jgi:transcription elongation factor Elf1
MSLFIDEKFVNSIGHLVRNFKKKQDYLWNFSCPICGDSKTKKTRARGYVYRYRDALRFKCHKCGTTLSLGELLRQIEATIYQEYVVETYLEKGQTPPKERKKVPFKKGKDYKPAKPTALIGCPSIASLGPDHPARAYLEWRKLPKAALERLYWTDDFPALVDNFLPEHQFKLVREGRIIIPFFDDRHQLVAMQGRSQPRYDATKDEWTDAPGAIRYITIKSDENAPRIFGMDTLDKITRRIYLVEGPFDSMFLPNCGAMAGSDIPLGFPKDRTIIVFDNEPYSPSTVKKLENAIRSGYKVCIWPDNIKEKDINQMVLKGRTPQKIREVIDTNFFSGLEALQQLQHWTRDKAKKKEESSSGKGNVASLTLKRHNYQL